jgi:Spy/CpxP family protein refolding chaperone
MKLTKTITVTAALGIVLAGTALAQRGPRGQGAGVGMRSWVLYENGVDSIAARIDLTDEQRSHLDSLAQQFRSENADALGRMTQMREEIDALWTEDQRPTREAMDRIAEEYGYPARDLRPALTRLHEDMAGIITVQQQRQLQRGALAGSMWGRRAMPGRGYRAPRMDRRSGRAMWGPRMYRGQRFRFRRNPPADLQP